MCGVNYKNRYSIRKVWQNNYRINKHKKYRMKCARLKAAMWKTHKLLIYDKNRLLQMKNKFIRRTSRLGTNKYSYSKLYLVSLQDRIFYNAYLLKKILIDIMYTDSKINWVTTFLND